MTTRKLSSSKYIYIGVLRLLYVYFTYIYIYNVCVGTNRLGKMGVSINCIEWIIASVNYFGSICIDRKNLCYSGNLSYRRKLSTDIRYVFRKHQVYVSILYWAIQYRSTNRQFAVHARFCFTAILVKKMSFCYRGHVVDIKHIIYYTIHNWVNLAFVVHIT